MKFNFEEGEILLINKPYQWTSFDVVNNIRMFLRGGLGIKKIKIGHTGTLDPLATGLLILCTGKFTKQIEQFKDLDKEYTGTFTLGSTTPSFDLETEVDTVHSWDHITEQEIQNVVKSMTGTFSQVPPIYSAIKIKGKRAYDYARKDQEVVVNPKQVTISAFEITGLRLPYVDFRVSVSKGTYIRAMARDFGKALHCGAHLNALCRNRIGNYHLRDAYELDDLKKSLLE
ncbi:MAG: tRNA pseudouridine(55) synthase TruB [Bacteroidetes bacterium]|nr:tRNA pseudouridine(55) synthase TruB [Bacteroidota bacterium]